MGATILTGSTHYGAARLVRGSCFRSRGALLGQGRGNFVVARKAAPKGPVTAAGAEVEKAGAVSFPIAGLGASAGGLEAFEQFFRRVPRDGGVGESPPPRELQSRE